MRGVSRCCMLKVCAGISVQRLGMVLLRSTELERGLFREQRAL